VYVKINIEECIFNHFLASSLAGEASGFLGSDFAGVFGGSVTMGSPVDCGSYADFYP
jgi:hypothetical protein